MIKNAVVEHNIKVFSNEAENFKKEYFSLDEKFIIEKYFCKQGGKVLVLGCGAGRTLKPLYKRGLEVTGIDITPEMVKAAKEKVRRFPIAVLHMDACGLDFKDNTFDYVFFPFHGIDYVYPNIYTSVLEARRVMKRNGIFAFSSHNRFNIKVLHRFFEGNYADYKGLITYRTTFVDFFKLRKYFKKVKMIQRISIIVSWKDSNWKDKVYKFLPFFNKSTWFVCITKT